MRYAQWIATFAVTCLVLLAPVRAAAQWVENGVNMTGSGIGMYNTGTGDHTVLASGAFVFVAAPGILGGDTDHVFVQKFDRYGAKLWGTNGIVPDNGGAVIGGTDLVPDGFGGVILAWEADGFVYAQRLDANGVGLWDAGGVIVDTAGGPPCLVGDSAGGALVVFRSSVYEAVRAQRLDAAGVPQLGPNGVAVTAQFGQEALLDVVDGVTGGAAPLAIVTYRVQGSNAIYAQKIDGAGNRLWGGFDLSLGPAMTFSIQDQRGQLSADETGGAWIAYEVQVGSVRNIRVVRVSSAGSIAESFAIGTPNESSVLPKLAYVGGGKAHLAWWFGLTPARVAITELGSLFDAHYVALGAERPTDLVADGTGGSVLVWEHENGGFFDVYAARYHPASGTPFPWGTGLGVPVCVASGSQFYAHMSRANTGVSGDYYLAWNDLRTASHIYVQRLDGGSGVWGHPEPSIVAAADCEGDDEGGCLRLDWIKSQLDGDPFIHPQDPVTFYSIWRAVDVLPPYPPDPICPQGMAAAGAGANRTTCEWEWVMNVNADGLPAYFANVPTTRDATPGDPATHYFAVVAANETDGFYVSSVISGASHDEVAPDAPSGIDGDWIGSYVYVDWSPSVAPDVDLYTVYHAERAGFGDPWSAWLPLGSSEDTTYTHTSADPALMHRYRATAVDESGNESGTVGHVTVSANPTGIDSPGAAPSALRVLDASPNPFGDATTLRVGMPRNEAVEIDVFDARGRRVHHETTKALGAGWHALRFEGRNTAGRLPSGVYFYRVRAGSETTTRKIVIVR
ncbi:MAG TPA: T9SS type A sorting domain-containing protein [Candidatus Krumholzibacteria bacterium]|nr:T9SS type A sorting domain-containing protein [Candidatus Krumholzibacteria bacterium]